MIRIILFLILISLFLINSLYSATYYVSKNGNDGRSGLDWNNSWLTLNKVNSTMSGGDTVFFGAGTWYGVITPPTGATPTDRTCYACSSFVEGITTISGAESITNWTNHSGNIYKAHYVPIANEIIYTLAEDDSLMGRVASLDDVNSSGKFFYNSGTDTMYIWGYSGENPNNHIIYASSRIVIDMENDNYDYITLWGLKVKYGHKVGIRIGGTNTAPDSVFVEHCEVSHVSGQSGQNTAGIATRTVGTDTLNYGYGNIIRGCYVHDIREEGGWYGHTKCINMYGSMYCVVESCYVNGCGIGINFKGNTPNGTYMKGNVIRYNNVTGATNGIDVTCWHINDSIYGNVIYNPAGDKWGITVEGYGITDGTIVYNNTMFGVSKAFVICPWEDDFEGDGNDGIHYFKYNIVYSPSASIETWVIKRDDTLNITVDSNIYYAGSMSFRTNSGSYNFTEWQNRYDFDLNSSTTNPGLINPAAGNFARSDSLNFEMNADYGGRRWTLFGAWQPGNQPDCDLPGATTLTSPANGATGLTQPLTFDWQDVATATLYQIQIDDNVAFNSPEIDSFATASTFNTSGLTAGATYHWRIKAYNACGWGNWSASRNFTTYCEQIGAPDIALPVDGADNQTQPVNLDWNSVTGADQYRVQVDDNPDFNSPERDQQTTASNYSVSGLADGTTYYWKVCAHNACGWGNWSTTSSFTTFSFATQTFDIYDLEVLNITDTSALIEWKTTEEATSRVEYGTTAGYGLSSPLSTGFQMVHSVLLTQLNQDTDYHFRVVCTNADDELSISPDSTFHTRSTISGNGSTLTGSSNTAYGALEPTLRVNNYDNNDDNVYYFEVAEDSSFALLVESSPAVPQEIGEVTSWQVTEELNIGQTYYWRANVNNLVYSPVYTFVIHPKTYAMPNPYRPDSDPPATFANVPSGSNLVIMSVSGNEVIKRWTNHSGGDILWDGTNQAGNRVASQTYLWFVENTNIKGKIIVIR